MSELRQFSDEVWRTEVAELEARCRAAEESKEAARERWTGCQDRLAELERLAQSLTGDETDIATNLRALHGQVAERDRRIADLETQVAELEATIERVAGAFSPGPWARKDGGR